MGKGRDKNGTGKGGSPRRVNRAGGFSRMVDREGRVGAMGCGGQENLRENREDPAPTVGNCGDINRDAARHVATNAFPPICACAPHRHRMRIPYAPHTSYLRDTLRFLSRRGMGREGTRHARHLPYRDIMGNLARNGILFCKPYINAASL